MCINKKLCENRVEIVYLFPTDKHMIERDSYVRLLLTKNFRKPSEKEKKEKNPHRILYLINYYADAINSSCEWGI